MSVDLAILIFASTSNVFLGCLALIRNPRRQDSQAFLAVSLFITAWSIANYFTDHGSTLYMNQLFARLSFLFAFLTVMALFTFTKVLNKGRLSRRSLLAIGLISILGELISLSPYVVQDIAHFANRTDAIPGSLYWFYIVLIIGLFTLCLYNLRSQYLEAGRDIRLKAQVKFIALGSGLSFALIMLTNGLLPILLNDWSISKFGPLMTAFLVASISYAIIRHRLFDLRLVVARSAAYVLLLTVLAGIYSVGLFGVSYILLPRASVGFSQEYILHISLAVVLAFTFQPLRRFFQKLTDRIFYRDAYDSHEVLSAVGKIMAEEILLERLLKKTLDTVCQSLRVEMGQFMIFDKERIFKVEHYGPLPPKLMVAPTMAKLHHSLLVSDELPSGQSKQILDAHGVRVSLMLRTHDTFVGFLFLGDKLNGDIYTPQDLNLLQILSQELAIAILNAKAYAEISRFNITLQQRVNNATFRLREANKNLKSLDMAKDEFISMVSHQLRTPLTTIKGYLSMMLDGDTGKITGEQKEFLGFAYEGAERMVSLINDLLNVSRLSAGRFVIDRKPTDLAFIVGDEVRQLRRHAEAKNLELVFIPPKRKLPLMELDESKTRQVIMNFIDNAIYYTRKGGVYINLSGNKDSVQLTVRDTGIGVPEEAKAKLFSKFYRASNAQIARPDGTGLGLFLAKQVVEDQGGSILFDSTENQGSTFGFTMPVHLSRKPARTTKSKPVITPVVAKPDTQPRNSKVKVVRLG